MSDEPSPALIGALANEQFGLQSSAGATISESGSRAGLYFSSLSSGLVALGFASSSPSAFPIFLFTVLPVVFLLGCFTVVRLIDTSAQNIVALHRIETIRKYWSTLDTRGADFFPSDAARSTSHGVRYGTLSSLFTTATMVSVVNSVVGGAVAAVALDRVSGPGPALVLGVVVGVALLAALLTYQHRRIGALRAGL